MFLRALGFPRNTTNQNFGNIQRSFNSQLLRKFHIKVVNDLPDIIKHNPLYLEASFQPKSRKELNPRPPDESHGNPKRIVQLRDNASVGLSDVNPKRNGLSHVNPKRITVPKHNVAIGFFCPFRRILDYVLLVRENIALQARLESASEQKAQLLREILARRIVVDSFPVNNEEAELTGYNAALSRFYYIDHFCSDEEGCRSLLNGISNPSFKLENLHKKKREEDGERFKWAKIQMPEFLTLLEARESLVTFHFPPKDKVEDSDGNELPKKCIQMAIADSVSLYANYINKGVTDDVIVHKKLIELGKRLPSFDDPSFIAAQHQIWKALNEEIVLLAKKTRTIKERGTKKRKPYSRRLSSSPEAKAASLRYN